MHITKHTDFAFRVLIYLASHQRLTTIQTIADGFDIPKSHTMKIVNKLVHAGWITAVRGRNGGIILGCDAAKISLKAVIELMENTLEPVNCKSPPCLLSKSCRLQGVLWKAQHHYLQYLAPITLANLIDSKTSTILNTANTAQVIKINR